MGATLERLNLATTRPSAVRGTLVEHRAGVSVIDKVQLGGFTVTAASGTIPAGVTGWTAGTLTGGATYLWRVIPYNRWGNAVAAMRNGSVVLGGADNAVILSFSNVPTGVEGFHIFLALNPAAPTWVWSLTTAQVAAGRSCIRVAQAEESTYGVVANQVAIGVDPAAAVTLAWNVAPFLQDNALVPSNATAIDLTGYTQAHIEVIVNPVSNPSLAVASGGPTALTLVQTAAPACSILPLIRESETSGDYYQAQLQALALHTTDGTTNIKDYLIEVNGGWLVVLVTALSPTGVTVDINVHPA